MKKILINTEIVTLPYKVALPVRGKKLYKNEFCKVSAQSLSPIYLSSLPNMHQSIATETKRTIDIFFDQEMISFFDVDFSKRFFNMIKDHQTAKYTFEQLFHIECVLFFLLKQNRPEVFSEQTIIKENAVYSSEEQSASYESFDSMKIKISPEMSAHNLISIMQTLHAQNSTQTFRLDGNRRFELHDFLLLMRDLKKNVPQLFSQVDYVEEPLKSFHEHAVAQKLAGVTLAVDESFCSYYANNQLQKLPPGCPVILKPTLIGVSNSYKLIKNHPQIRFIISSSFEHPTLRELYVYLAALRPLEVHGISSATISVG